MWDEIAQHLAEFSSGVLTGVDSDGYPVSVRCRPQLDPDRRVLDVGIRPGTRIPTGPACLLCHRHDARLWNLKSFVVRGTLEPDDRGWHLRPARFIPGMGIGGVLGWIRLLRSGRRAAIAYLRRRGLPRPEVKWGEVRALLAQAKEDP